MNLPKEAVCIRVVISTNQYVNVKHVRQVSLKDWMVVPSVLLPQTS